MMWELISCLSRNKDEVESYLKAGFEPFAVSEDTPSERVWLKRKKSEIHSKSELIKAPSTKAFTDPKE